MDPIFKKLNHKDQAKVFILNPPESFQNNLKNISAIAEVKTSIRKTDKVEFAMIFAEQRAAMEKLVTKVAPQLVGDAIFWIAYPKKSSKKYKSDFHRDQGWEILGQYEMEGVRSVAIDEDWSAIRFRKVDFIKTMTRKFQTLSKKGADKVKKGK